jgi:hypothetical protein
MCGRDMGVYQVDVLTSCPGTTSTNSFADVQSHANSYGGSNTTIITNVDGSSAVWLTGVDMNAITAADFVSG